MCVHAVFRAEAQRILNLTRRYEACHNSAWRCALTILNSDKTITPMQGRLVPAGPRGRPTKCVADILLQAQQGASTYPTAARHQRSIHEYTPHQSHMKGRRCKSAKVKSTNTHTPIKSGQTGTHLLIVDEINTRPYDGEPLQTMPPQRPCVAHPKLLLAVRVTPKLPPTQVNSNERHEWNHENQKQNEAAKAITSCLECLARTYNTSFTHQ